MRSCPIRGCPAVVPDKLVRGSHRCPAHQRAGNSALGAFGTTGQWRRIRRQHVSNYPLCEVVECSQPVAVVDHFVSRQEGGGDEPSNLVSLCKQHNYLKTHKGIELPLRPRPTTSALDTFA
jgi:5-methylcytosine-specific restriction endonuclease McrA